MLSYSKTGIINNAENNDTSNENNASSVVIKNIENNEENNSEIKNKNKEIKNHVTDNETEKDIDDRATIRRNIWDDFKRTFESFTHDCKNLLIDFGVPISHEHIARIVDVQPICAVDDMPFGYRDGKCYHLVVTADGLIFKLIFSNISFSTLEKYLQPNKIVKITYKDPDFRIVNIFPQRLYRMLTYSQFIGEYHQNINKNSIIRICSLDDNIIKIEFLDSNQNNKTNNQVENIYIDNDIDIDIHMDENTETTVDSHSFQKQYDLIA